MIIIDITNVTTLLSTIPGTLFDYIQDFIAKFSRKFEMKKSIVLPTMISYKIPIKFTIMILKHLERVTHSAKL